MSEFARSTLEALRQPLEIGRAVAARAYTDAEALSYRRLAPGR